MGDYELYHAATRKHKYIKKIGKRYFYTQDEIKAYLEGKKKSIDEMSIGSVTESSGGIAKPIGIELRSDKRREFDKKQAEGGYFIDEKGQPYTREYYNKKKGVYVKDGKITAFSSKNGSTNEHTLDSKKTIDKNLKKARDLKETVAEAIGRRDVYYEAKKVTENGRTYYDDDNAELRTGTKDKRGKVGDDGAVYTKKGTMQYDNEYTRELNKKTRERGKKKLKKMATSPVRSLKKQAVRGKKKLESIYKPKSTVTIIDRVDSRTGKHF